MGEWRANSDMIAGGSLDFQGHLAAFPLISHSPQSGVGRSRDLHCIYLATHDLVCVRRLESQCQEAQCRTRHDTVERVVSRWSSL